jgi:methyltransferase OMS1, mitochondrial
MLQRAFAKYKTWRTPQWSHADWRQKPEPAFTIMNSQRLQYESDSFDTVVDTFGLCSHADPVEALREMARVCRPHGRILLLEHGRQQLTKGSWWEYLLGPGSWMNEALDKTARKHSERWGCWWNRDIVDLVGQAGLDVVEMKQYHFGTTYWIIAKPCKSLKSG